MDKEYAKLQIAGEAILHGIDICWKGSNSCVVAVGEKFSVAAYLNEK